MKKKKFYREIKKCLSSVAVPVPVKKTENHIQKEPVHLELNKPQIEVKAIKPEVKPTKKYDPESMEDEHIYMKKKKHYAHAQDNTLDVQQVSTRSGKRLGCPLLVSALPLHISLIAPDILDIAGIIMNP
jgi:hypothetical protein